MTEEDRSDAELIAAVRAGDSGAFEALYRRHVDSARRMARVLARDQFDVDDLIAESFARLLSVLTAGGGPEMAFRSYLLSTMRHLFYERTKQDRRLQVMDDLAAHEPVEPFVDTAMEALELSFVSRAFAKLPERWQLVLWHTEVERERPAEVATLLGLSPNGVSALAYRAREGLRQQYLQEHIAAEPDDDCQFAIERLGAYVRDGLSNRDRVKVDAHVSECRRCGVLFVDLGEVNSSMRELLGVAVLAGSAGGYLAGGGAAVASAGAFWGPFHKLARRRSTQVAAGAVAVAAVIAALALTLTSQPTPIPTSPPPVVANPPAPSTFAPTPSPPAAVPQTSAPPREAAGLEASLEPVGALVRGRPGALALTVRNLGGGSGAFGPRAIALRSAVDTGPLTATITVPSGVALASGVPGDGWACAQTASGMTCRRPSLATGQTSRAFVPVELSAAASGGALTVRIAAPNARATSATRLEEVQTSGLSAAFAARLPATVVTGGNALMHCTILLLGCLRNGTDNGDFYMTGYRDPAAPSGAPFGAWVSGAKVPVHGEVLWAGLYWAGSGTAPANAVAHLRAPGTTRYVAVKANRVDQVSGAEFSQPAFQATADVTTLVRGTSAGTWWLAVDQEFKRGFGSFGGWAVVVVVKDPGAARTVVVLDGFQPLRARGSASIPLYGTAGAQARIAFVGWEGDRGLAGDQLVLGDQALGGAQSGNIAASLADGTPAGWNTFGVDARILDGRLPAGPSRPAITATTVADAWILGAIAIAAA